MIKINAQKTINTNSQSKNDLDYKNRSNILVRKRQINTHQCRQSFKANYQGIEVVSGFDKFNCNNHEVLKHLAVTQMIQTATKLIDSEIKTAVEKIPTKKPVKFIVSNFISGNVTLDIRGSFHGAKYFKWTRRILPKKNNDNHFGSFYFIANNTHNSGLYIKTSTDFDKINTYTKVADSTPESVGDYLKKVFLRSIDKLDIKSLYNVK